MTNANTNKYLALFFAMGSFAATAAQPPQCKPEQAMYQRCDTHTGWYMGGALGLAQADISHRRIERYFEQSGLDITQLHIDNDDVGGNIFAGYQFNSYFALEAGYLDLGERTVHFSGRTTDIAAYYDAAEHIYPQSGDGALVALVASWPLSERLKVSAKMGYFDWEGDYITFDARGNQGSDRVSASDLLFGGELQYRFNEHIQLVAAYQQVELNRDTNDMLSIGMRYYFGEQPSSIKATHVPPPPATVAVVVKPTDSDNDGINDKQDACPRSEPAYRVDERGCTLKQERIVDFSLVINYANDSVAIDSNYEDRIVALAEFIKRHQVKTLTVYGHTSAPGSKSYNMILSEKRARSVAQKLAADFGIDETIITAVGKGESELKASGQSEQAHQQNRRIELEIKEPLLMPVKR